MSNTTPFLQRLADWNQGMNDVPRRLLIIAAVALACYIAVQLFPFCWPFVLALVFASLMEPVARLLRKAFKRFKAARSIATLLCMLLLYGLITILFFTITDKLVRECISLARTLPDLAVQAQQKSPLDNLRKFLESFTGPVVFSVDSVGHRAV